MRICRAAASLGFALGMMMGAALAGPPAFSGSSGDFVVADPPRPVPDLAFLDGEGRPVTLGDFRGRVVLLNLWATWCGPCVKEMPSLDRLQESLGGAAFQVVALSQDRAGGRVVEGFFEKHGLAHLPMYLDPTGEAMKVLKPRGLPLTVLIDREGNEIGRLEGGAEWDSGEAKRLVGYALKGPRGR
ncbi:MAG TPA: TlpA disulfide reductase family protein [Azospirillaceae bacterium]|nr:TlpA disulfide reductase family protein [Azospirillaceae bacterium]